MESITAYKIQYGQHRSGKKFMTFTFAIIRKILDRLIFKTVNSFTGTQEQPGTHVAANDMCALDEWPTRVEGQRAVCLYVRGAWGLAESESVGCFGSKCCWDIFFLLWPIYIGIGRVKIPGWAAAHPGHPVAPPLFGKTWGKSLRSCCKKQKL